MHSMQYINCPSLEIGTQPGTENYETLQHNEKRAISTKSEALKGCILLQNAAALADAIA